ncbi:MAG: extracellular solute-binding protein, partial [Anaerolineae bacterium]|nr:extracellular solute-binding protein [Anaerolineae bacterium]
MKTKSKLLFAVILLVAMVLSACQPAAEPVVEEAPQPAAEETAAEEETVVEEAPAAEEAEPVTLEFYHWFGADIGETLIKEINDRFHAEYPNITVEFETADTDTYEQVMTTRLSANDAPDVFGVFPGTKFHPQAEAGYLMDLSNEP